MMNLLLVTIVLTACSLTYCMSPTVEQEKEEPCLKLEKIDQNLALLVVEYGVRSYNTLKKSLSIAIVDNTAPKTLKAYARHSGYQQNDDDRGMNEAWLKARRSNTKEYTDGSLAIRNCKNEVLGAVGVSGADDETNHEVAKILLEVMLDCAGNELQCVKDVYKVNEEDKLEKAKSCIEEINDNTAMYGLRLGMSAASFMKEKLFIAILDANKNLISYVRMDGAGPYDNDHGVIINAANSMENGDSVRGVRIRSSTNDKCSGKVIGGIGIAAVKSKKKYKKVAVNMRKMMKRCGRSQLMVKWCMNFMIKSIEKSSKSA